MSLSKYFQKSEDIFLTFYGDSHFGYENWKQEAIRFQKQMDFYLSNGQNRFRETDYFAFPGAWLTMELGTWIRNDIIDRSLAGKRQVNVIQFLYVLLYYQNILSVKIIEMSTIFHS